MDKLGRYPSPEGRRPESQIILGICKDSVFNCLYAENSIAPWVDVNISRTHWTDAGDLRDHDKGREIPKSTWEDAEVSRVTGVDGEAAKCSLEK